MSAETNRRDQRQHQHQKQPMAPPGKLGVIQKAAHGREEGRNMNTRNQPKPLLEALAIIRAALEEPKERTPEERPTSLDRRRITTAVAVFQTREIDGRWAEDRAHVKTLKTVIGNAENPQHLDPVTVWWGGDRWYLIDGHRRLAAYHQAGISKGIPVVVFEGSLDDAMAQSAALNSKDHMPMTTEDKMNFAWKLAITTQLSRSRMMRACAVSKGSVDNIRTVRAKLLEERGMTLEEITTLSWRQARDEADDRERPDDYDPDEALRRRAEKYRKDLLRALGGRITADTEAVALAFLMIDRRLPGQMIQSEPWREPLREAVGALRDDLGDDAEWFLEEEEEADQSEEDY